MTSWIDLQRQWIESAARVPGASADAMRAIFADLYRQLFTPEFAHIVPAPDPLRAGAAAMTRWQAATQRFGLQVAAISNDASRRLSEALLVDEAGVAPITSLRQLHELWVDCGEAAYAAAAHGEEFAQAQAELLAAWVESSAAAQQTKP